VGRDGHRAEVPKLSKAVRLNQVPARVGRRQRSPPKAIRRGAYGLLQGSRPPSVGNPNVNGQTEADNSHNERSKFVNRISGPGERGSEKAQVSMSEPGQAKRTQRRPQNRRQNGLKKLSRPESSQQWLAAG